MALITRVARLFRADFNAVLDRVEEPEVLLRQAIREMEEDLASDDQLYRRQQREHEQLGKRESEMQRLCTSLSEELEVCFAANKEDLARSVMRRKLETERSLELLARRRETIGIRIDELAGRLSENRALYESMRQKAELFDTRNREAEVQDAWDGGEVRVRDEDVEVALLKARRRRAGK